MKTPPLTRISIAFASALALAWIVWAPDVIRLARTSIAVAPFFDQVAAIIIAHNPKSADGIRARYIASSAPDTLSAIPKVRILLVPGHEPSFGGAEYPVSKGAGSGDTSAMLKERDLTVELAQDLSALLAHEPRYEVYVTRDASAWSPTFAAYFKNNWKDIVAWQKVARSQELKSIAMGSTTALVSKVFHNSAPQNVALRLYGITKWANENDIDITIHIHFNDDPTRTGGHGNYTGFAVYVPAEQYANASSSQTVGQAIAGELKNYEPVSNLPGESSGIVDDPALIATGANDTANAASVLIEYAYIYEPSLANPATRSTALQNMATYTYYGLQDFFKEASSSQPRLTQ